MNRFILLFVFLVYTTSLLAQVEFPTIDKKDIKTYVQILSSDSLEGRYTGTVGQKKAALYLKKHFKNLGLISITSDDYFQKVEMQKRYWKDVYIRKDDYVLENFEEMIYLGTNAENDEIKAEVVYGGYGSLKELNQIEIKNKLVFLLSKNIRASLYNDEIERRGGLGIILVNPTNEYQFNSLRNTYKNFVLMKRLFLMDTTKSGFNIHPDHKFIIPNHQVETIMGVSLNYLEKLAENGNVKDCPSAKIAFKTERIIKDVTTENVLGLIKGKTNKTIVVSAHYDHLGMRGGYLFAGADDNASGTAAIMELAEMTASIKNPEYNVLFMATSAEEQGMLGSKYFVNSSLFDSLNVVMNINIDMIGRNDEEHQKSDSYLYCVGLDEYPQLTKFVQAADEKYTKCKIDYSLDEPVSESWIYRYSDQIRFHEADVPSIIFFTGLHDDYHTSQDLAWKINYNILTDRIKLIANVLYEVLQPE